MFISNSVRGTLLGVLAVCALAVAPAANAQLKVGVVSSNQIVAPQYNAARAAVQKEFQGRERDLVNERKELEARAEKLKKEAAVMAEVDRLKAERDLRDAAAALNRKGQDLQQDAQRRLEQEEQKINKAFLDEVTAYAKAQNYDLVIGDGVGVLYAKDSINITAEVLSALKAKAGPAPAAAPKPAEKKP